MTNHVIVTTNQISMAMKWCFITSPMSWDVGLEARFMGSQVPPRFKRLWASEML